MSEELDERLRQALRPVDPGQEFTDVVMSRVGNPSHAVLRSVRTPAWRWLSGAAAAILIATLLVHARQVRHTREGLAARQALLQALQVTSKSLELAKQAVNDSSANTNAPDSGV